MTNKQTGWTLLVAAVGMMLGLMSADIRQLMYWSDATTPAFIGTMLGHMGVVIMAFIGGKLIPTEQGQRSGDNKD